MNNKLWKTFDWTIAVLFIIMILSAILALIIAGYEIQAEILKFFL